MARERRTRVNGPYAHRGRWRVFVVHPSGKRDVRSFETKEQAEEVIRSLNRELGGQATIEEAIGRYVQWVKSTGVRDLTVRNAEAFLRRFFDGKTGASVGTVTPSKARALYADMLGVYAVATHRQTLVEAKRFGGWLVKAKLARTNPIEGVEPVGMAKAGKPQLRLDEARKLLEVCFAAFGNGDQTALIPILCLGLALRSGEVVGLQARDVDDGGRMLWVSEAKTRAGKRVLEVADAIAACLAHQAKDRVGQLIPGLNRNKVSHHVEKWCRKAGVEVVCPHGLRGTHATLAAGRGATSALVIEALGHTSIAMTKKHYLAPGTLDRAQAKAAWVSLAGPRDTQHPIDVVPDGKGEQ